MISVRWLGLVDIDARTRDRVAVEGGHQCGFINNAAPGAVDDETIRLHQREFVLAHYVSCFVIKGTVYRYEIGLGQYILKVVDWVTACGSDLSVVHVGITHVHTHIKGECTFSQSRTDTPEANNGERLIGNVDSNR